MTYPSSGPAYPQQGGAAPTNQPPSGYQQWPQQGRGPAVSTLNVAVVLALATTVLGFVDYFIGFSDDAEQAGEAIQFLLIGGLLGALRVLPNGPKVLPFATLVSVLGGLYGIVAVVRVPEGSDVPGVLTVVLILGILQLLAAVAALLFDYGVLTVPTPAPQAPYGQPYGQQFAQPPQQPQPGAMQGPESGGGAQSTQYGPPVPPTASQQSTLYASQQGQFYQQQVPEPGQQAQQPGSSAGQNGPQ